MINYNDKTKSDKYQAIEILLVEDNPHDARLTIEALKENRMANVRHLRHVIDGEKAIAYLNKEGEFADSLTPDIVLLDINLPKVSGIEVLKYIRESKKLSRLPVIMLTTSAEDKDIIKAYDLHVNSYVSKPVEFDEFINVVKQLENFWFTIVKLPPIDD